MNQPNGDPGREPAARHSTARERELEVELARASAELEAMQGGDLMQTTSRFLEMAANTVDLVMVDARREADELAAEISADAERRRDDAVRIASEAETTAARLQAEATDAEAAAAAARAAAQQVTLGAKRELEAARGEAKVIVDEACAEADKLESGAAATAAEIIETARAKAREELEVLTDARAELERERAALREYNERLGTRVQDLADSMVAFMTMESPLTGATLGAYAPGELHAAEAVADHGAEVAGVEEITPEPEVASEPLDADVVAPAVEAIEPEPVAEHPVAEEQGVEETVAEQPVAEAMAHEEIPAEPVIEYAEEPQPAGDPFARFGEAAERVAEPTIDPVEAAPETDSPAFDLKAFGSVSSDSSATPDFDPEELRVETTASDELFGSATPEEAEPSPLSELFRNHGAQLIEQTPPEELASAIDQTESAADEQFQNFLDGDDEEDPSRDWLLRPESS